MNWTDHAIFWHVYPLGFCGAPIREPEHTPVPRLRRLLPWLDYAVELGVSGILLGPVSHSRTHGYDILNQYRIDPRLGEEADFADLIRACHDRGLRVVLDGVFSHVSDQHPWLTQAVAEGRHSQHAEFFDIDWEVPAAEGGPRPRVFEGHDSLVRLNHDSPRVQEHAAAVMVHWLDRGVAGWRLDAAYSIDPEFWSAVVAEVRRSHPDAWLFGEVIHGDYPEFIARTDLDSLTQYELWKAIWSGIRDRNFFELEWTLQRHNEFLAEFTPQTFIGNHDVTRIASTLGQEHAVMALAVLLTVGGVPSIYAGDEQGFTGIKREELGGDDDVRPAFPEDPAKLSDLGAKVHRAHRELIGLRRRHPWLVRATTTTLEVANTSYRYRVSGETDSQELVVDLDLAAGEDADQISVRITDGAGELLWKFDGAGA